MSSATVSRRIFVVGAPRSGTTLVQSLLAAHSCLTSFTESHFFSRNFKPLPWPPWAIAIRSPLPRLCEFLLENEVESGLGAALEDRARRVVPVPPLMPLRTRAIARELLETFDQLALSRRASGWVEKTPMHLRYIRFLDQVMHHDQGTHFVHVVRPGLDVVASLHSASQKWERAYDLRECAGRWNSDMRTSLARVRSPRDHFVFYERLTRSPRHELARLLNHLELEEEPEILERYGEGWRQLVTDDETWKTDVGSGVRRSARRRELLPARHRLRPLVSVVVPFFDRAGVIGSCVESLRSQEEIGGPYEIIMVDNGSTDSSAAIVRRYPEVTLLAEQTPGAYAARNAGISRARAPVVAFTDADCVVAKDWLKVILGELNEPRTAIVVGQCRYPEDASLVLRLLGAWENAKAEYVIRRCPPENRFAYCNNMAVRASVFDEIGLFEEWERAADSELVHRLAARRPDLGLTFSAAMRVTHLEFVHGRARARRLRLYARTNAKISTFRELGFRQRLAILARLALASASDETGAS